MTDWIGETFTSDVGWSHLEHLVDIGDRMAGSPGERDGLEATRDALTEVGARDPHIEPFPIQGWVRGTSTIYAGETTQSCIALPRSPSGDAEGRLVDLGHGLPADFEADLDGAVVMVRSDVPDHFDRFIHRREKYYRAVEAGAAAFVFRNHVPGQLPPTGSVGTKDDPIGTVPAVGVSREVGSRLARRFDGERVTVHVECETPEADSGNVHADLGPDTDDAVWLTSHVDAHDIAEGALDNGMGTAMVVEVARALAAREDELGRRVHCCCFGSEEVGLVGSEYQAAETDHDTVHAMVNCDGVGGGRTLKLWSHGNGTLTETARAVGETFDHPVETNPDHVPHSDHWPFVRHGVPGYMVGSESDDRGRGWGHTEADTLDKLESRTLREQAILLTELVVRLTNVETIDRLDEAEIAAALEAQDDAEGMKLTGDWPF